MSRVLSASEICQRALRMIGKFPVTESAPDGEDMREALFWLDLVMAEVAGTTTLFFLVPVDPVTLTLEAGTQDYNLSETLGSAYPTSGIDTVQTAWIEDEAGNRTPLTIVHRDTFDAKPDPDETGVPCEVYIDRLDKPTLKTWPTLDADETATYTIGLEVQTYAPNVAPAGVTGTQPTGTALTLFRQAWQRWLIYRLAQDLGSGAIAKLPENSLRRFQETAEEAFRRLEAFENRSHDTEPPIAEPHAPYRNDEPIAGGYY